MKTNRAKHEGAVFSVLLAILFVVGMSGFAAAAPSCEKQIARFLETGRGDRDFDGLTNCEERLVGTSSKDPDSDDDGVEDGDEIENGTDPLDADSDDDGMSDGEEEEVGCDPPRTRTRPASSSNGSRARWTRSTAPGACCRYWVS